MKRYAYQYLITLNGINDGQNLNPTVNFELDNVNFPNGGNGEIQGHIKFSPDGSFLCDANSTAVTLYYFDNQTGSLMIPGTNIFTTSGVNNAGQGLDFSPNSQLIYFSSYLSNIIYQDRNPGIKSNPNDTIQIWQYNINEGNHPIVIGSIVLQDTSNLHSSLIPIHANYGPFSIQRAIDNIIYVAPNPFTINGGSYLGAITKPNLPGLACTFVNNALLLLPGTGVQGNLPQWVHKATVCNLQPAEILPTSYFNHGNEPNQNIIPNSNNIFCVPWENSTNLYLNTSYLSGNLWYINDIPIPTTGSYPGIGWVEINNNTSQLHLYGNVWGKPKFQIKNELQGCGVLSPPTYVELINTPLSLNFYGYYKPDFLKHISIFPVVPSGYGESYTWSIPGTIITNANSLTGEADVYFPPTIPLPTVSGTLTVSNSPYCNGIYNIFFTYNENPFSKDPSIIKTKNEITTNIFPNPATNRILVTSSENINFIEISNLMNPTLKIVKVYGIKSLTISVSDLKPGVYNFKITTTGRTENHKIIIHR